MQSLVTADERRQLDTLTADELTEAAEPLNTSEQRALDADDRIRLSYSYPWYRFLHGIEKYRAKLAMLRLPYGGQHLKRFAREGGLKLRKKKILHLSRLIRTLKPQLVYEFGSGASTPLIAELLRANQERFGVEGKLVSFEQCPNYFERIESAFPDELRPYVQLNLAPVRLQRIGQYRTLCYDIDEVPAAIDMVFIDGPAPPVAHRDTIQHPPFSGDLVELVNRNVAVRFAATDVRWFNYEFFKDTLGDRFTFHKSITHKSILIRPRVK